MTAAAWFYGQSFCGPRLAPVYLRRQIGGRPADQVDLERDVIRHVDADHAEPLRNLGVGEEYEIPQMSGMPPIFIKRVS